MNHQTRKRQRFQQQEDDEGQGHSNGANAMASNDNELKLKLAASEAKNEMYEEKLENHKLAAQIKGLKEENKALKMEAAEQRKTHKERMDEMAKKSRVSHDKQKKEIAELKARLWEEENKVNQLKAANESNARRLVQNNEANFPSPISKQGKLSKVGIIGNPMQNRWNKSNSSPSVSIYKLGLYATDDTNGWPNIFAEKGFPISGEYKDNYAGTILYYYEVTQKSLYSMCDFRVGLSAGGSIGECVGSAPNSYAFQHGLDHCLISGQQHWFEWPNGAIRPEWNGQRDVVGCGILVNRANELAIFFTANGTLLGKQIPIVHPARDDRLYPTVCLRNSTLSTNFGDYKTKPFKYDVIKCPGLHE